MAGASHRFTDGYESEKRKKQILSKKNNIQDIANVEMEYYNVVNFVCYMIR